MSIRRLLWFAASQAFPSGTAAGNLTWLQPWQAGHKAGPVSRPLRAGGMPYRGVNVLMLWAEATEKGYSCPLWLTYKQASELGRLLVDGRAN
jgi:antirestriction protein ArdC